MSSLSSFYPFKGNFLKQARRSFNYASVEPLLDRRKRKIIYFRYVHQIDIHGKKDFCGGDGFLAKKNWRKIWPKNDLKSPKIAKIWPKNGLKWHKMA